MRLERGDTLGNTPRFGGPDWQPVPIDRERGDLAQEELSHVPMRMAAPG